MKRLLIVCLFFSFSFVTVFAQVSPAEEAKARKELEELGISDTEIQQRLLEKGIDIGSIDPTDPTQVMEAERALEESVRELQEEKRREEEAAEKKIEAAEEQATETIKEAEEQAEGALDEELREVSRESADEIKDAVKDGATIEEAISEELIDAQEGELPAAKVWGQQIFRNKSISLYRASKDVKPPNSYILGAGDVVNVSIWGMSQENVELEINEEGYVQPFRMPRIYLKGVTLGKAKTLLESRFLQNYRFRPEEFEVTLNFARTITINIVGEVYNYGSFTIPAINTAFNALVAAGGPSDIGSVRNIRLMRAGDKPRTIDIYKFLLNPSTEEELYLEENDYLHVPIAEKIVTISGMVKRPFKYELLPNENLKELIAFAGGLQDNAYLGNIQIKRFINDEEVILDVNLKNVLENRESIVLLPSDEIYIGKIEKPYENFVTVTGAVEKGGRFQVKENTQISEIMGKAILAKDALTDIAYIKRMNVDGTLRYFKIDLQEALDNTTSSANIFLEPDDKIIVYSTKRYTDTYSFTVEGSVREPSNLQFDIGENLKISDAIFLSGGLRYDATDFAYITRKKYPKSEKEKRYIRVDLTKILADSSSSENMTIEPGDKLKVFSKLTYIDNFFVEISGSIHSPGQYQYDESLKLKDVLTMSGGFKFEAAKNRIDIYRLLIEEDRKTQTVAASVTMDDKYNIIDGDADFELQPYDEIIVREAPEYELKKHVTITGEIVYPGEYALINDNELLHSVIKRSGNITEEAFPEGATLFRPDEGTGYVIINLHEVLKNPKVKYNLILKDGDVIDIPKRKDLVTIIGETRIKDLYSDKVAETNKVNVAYYPGKNAKFYVDKYAGGVGEKGRRRLISVEHPNGEFKKTKNYFFFKKYPKVRKGSIVKIGRISEKEKEPGMEQKEKKDWGEILANTVGQATAVLSLILLVQTVN